MKLDVVSYNLAIKACSGIAGTTLPIGQLDQGFALLREMRDQGLEPDLVTYTSLMALCVQAKSGRRAEQLHKVIIPHLTREKLPGGRCS